MAEKWQVQTFRTSRALCMIESKELTETVYNLCILRIMLLKIFDMILYRILNPCLQQQRLENKEG